MRLMHKIVILFVLCSLTPLAVSSIYSFYSVRETLRQEIFSELDLSVKDSLQAFESRLANSLLDLETWGRLRVMQDVLIVDEGKEIAAAIEDLNARYPEFSQLAVTDGEGKIIAATSPSARDAAKRSGAAFKTALKGQLYSGPFEDSDLSSQATMTLAAPISADYDDKTIVGTLIGVVDWTYLEETLAAAPIAAGAQGPNRLLAISDLQTGKWIYQTSAVNQNSTGLSPFQTADGTEAGSGVGQTVTLDGKQFIVASARSQQGGSHKGPALLFHAAVSTPVAFASIAQFGSQLLIAAIITFCATLGLGLIGANGVTGPITSMIGIMKRLADGETSLSFPDLDRKDEIGNMARALKVFHSTKLEHDLTRKSEQKRLDQEEIARRKQAENDAEIQNQIDNTVRAAVVGDFTKRVDTKAADGVMLSLSEGMNTLLDVVDRGLTDTVTVMSSMAKGDLTKNIDGDYQGSFATLKDDTNRMGEQTRAIASRIVQASVAVQDATNEIATGVTDLSMRTEHQASSLEETSASMEELSATVRQNAENAQEANQLAALARESATNGGEIAESAVSAMSRIEDSSRSISEIVGLIHEIAFQTNLLALNAAVEAARAGDAGRGFGVVASEVRALAERSRQASTDIEVLISNSNVQIHEGVGLVNKAGQSLEEIVTSVTKVADYVSEIAAASQAQSMGINQVGQAIHSMDEMTRQNSSLVEETTVALKSAQMQIDDLRDVVTFFKIDAEAEEASSVDSDGELAAGPFAEVQTALMK